MALVAGACWHMSLMEDSDGNSVKDLERRVTSVSDFAGVQQTFCANWRYIVVSRRFLTPKSYQVFRGLLQIETNSFAICGEVRGGNGGDTKLIGACGVDHEYGDDMHCMPR